MAQLKLLLLLLLLQTLNGIVHARGLQVNPFVLRNEARKAMVRKIEEWGSTSRQNMLNDKTEKTRVGMVSVKPFGRLGNATNAQNDTMREVGIAHSCPAVKVGKPFSVFTDVVKIMNDLKAPYNLHAGTLLFFVRDCKLASDDFDFVVPIIFSFLFAQTLVSISTVNQFNPLTRDTNTHYFFAKKHAIALARSAGPPSRHPCKSISTCMVCQTPVPPLPMPVNLRGQGKSQLACLGSEASHSRFRGLQKSGINT